MEIMHPPEKDSSRQVEDWVPPPADHPTIPFIERELWDQPQPPRDWRIARLSAAAYVYRETASGWSIVAKFYAAKTGDQAEHYAAREYQLTQGALAAGLESDPLRAVKPLALWRGVLFLEYVRGFTLEDLIAVRRGQPGALRPALEQSGRLLARLHRNSRAEEEEETTDWFVYTHKLAANLAKHGVLQGDPVTQLGLTRLIDRWAERPLMGEYLPAVNHGDATTTNFIFPAIDARPRPTVVGIDWERSKITDPASDLGRLGAEISHSIARQGGTVAEAQPLVDCLQEAYCAERGVDFDAVALIERARFHQASSLLRIARNGWLSRLERIHLVAQAMALMA
jgi:aminoglycoside phosphotransferase (APT) family kinase protein